MSCVRKHDGELRVPKLVLVRPESENVAFVYTTGTLPPHETTCEGTRYNRKNVGSDRRTVGCVILLGFRCAIKLECVILLGFRCAINLGCAILLGFWCAIKLGCVILLGVSVRNQTRIRDPARI